MKFLLFSIFITALFAQEWKILNGPSGPSGRRTCMAWCPASSSDFFVFGGQTASGRANDLWRFSETSGWSPLSPSNPPPARSGACTWSKGSALYLYGGRDDAGTALQDFWKFEAGQWTQLSSTPLPALFGSSCWQHESFFFLYGGTQSDKTNTDLMFRYNTISDQWSAVTYSGTGPGAIDDRQTALRSTSDHIVLILTDQLYQFNSDTLTFSLVPVGGGASNPVSREDNVYFKSSTNQVCTIGGRYSLDQSLVIGEGVSCFDLSSSAWSTKPNTVAPTSRWGMCSCFSETRNSVMAFGGVEQTYYHSALWSNAPEGAGQAPGAFSFIFEDVPGTVAAVFAALCFILICASLIIFIVIRRRDNSIVRM